MVERLSSVLSSWAQSLALQTSLSPHEYKQDGARVAMLVVGHARSPAP